MKIAFFAEGYEPFINGVVTSLTTLQQALAQHGHEVVIFVPAYPGHEDGNDKVVRLPSVKWSKTCYPCLSPLVLGKDVLAGQGFDLVHSHHPFTMSLLAEHLTHRHGMALVYTFHTMLQEYSQYVPLFQHVGERLLTRIFLRHCAEADRVVVSTAVVRDFLREQGVKTPIAVAAAGVPLLAPTLDGRERVRRQLGLSDDIPVLLYAGRLAKEKQLDFLLRSLTVLSHTHDFRLCLAGGGPRERHLRELARRLGIADRVIFCGWVPHEQMADHYAAADVFVFPSTSDTMGIVLVEAMSVGLPCVAVDKYGPCEVVRDEVTGFLAPFEERAFANAVRRLLDSQPLRRRMGRAAFQRARDFAPSLAVDELCAVYDDALRSRCFPQSSKRHWALT